MIPKNGLTNHIDSTHTEGIKSFICDICGKSFFIEEALIKHIFSTHNENKPVSENKPVPDEIKKVQCNICEKFFLGPGRKKHLKRFYFKFIRIFCLFTT